MRQLIQYSFFHEGNFRQRLADNLLPDHLTFAVMATTLRFSTNPFFEGQTTSAAEIFANRSWKSIVTDCLAGDTAADFRTVQTITLLAIYDFTGKIQRSVFSKPFKC
jgi:hypothetical protein